MKNDFNNYFIKCYKISKKNDLVTMNYSDGTTKEINFYNAKDFALTEMQKENNKRIVSEYNALKRKTQYYMNLVLEQRIVNEISPYLFYLTQQYPNMNKATLISMILYLMYKVVNIEDYLENEALLGDLKSAKEFYNNHAMEKVKKKK